MARRRWHQSMPMRSLGSALCGAGILSHSAGLSALAGGAGRASVPLFFNDVYEVPLPPQHRFPMAKYRAVRECLQRRIQDDDGNPGVAFFVSPLASPEELKSTHCPQYVDRFLQGRLDERETRRVGFPWSPEHVARSLSSVGGTVAAMRAVLSSTGGESLLAGHIAGGTHHAFYDHGEGFCVFSDIAVATNLALREFPERVRRVLIVDLDVHQGNGNAVLFDVDKRVTTFSMHCEDNLFSARQVSTVDVDLPAGVGDEEYLRQLRTWLPHCCDAPRRPDLIFFQAGVDPHADDKLGRLRLTREGLRRRNRMVYEAALNRGVPLVVTMGGGYPRDTNPSSDAFREVVDCHADVYSDAIDTYRTFLAKRPPR